MQKRKVIENYAEGFISSFISRYNDIDGYWGMGKLYNHARQNQTSVITINLLAKVMIPAGTKFETSMNSWSEAIKYRFGEPRFSKNWLANAIIMVEFRKYSPDKKQNHRIGRDTDPAICNLNIEDILGNSYHASRTFACRPHDPLSELRSTRTHLDSFLSHLAKD